VEWINRYILLFLPWNIVFWEGKLPIGLQIEGYHYYFKKLHFHL